MAEKVLINKTHKLAGLLNKPGPQAPATSHRTLVIMLHGFPGHAKSNNDIFGDLAFLLTEKGCHTLRFNFRFCDAEGAQSEKFTLTKACEDIHSVKEWAKSEGYDSFIFIGEGLGASAAIMSVDDETKALLLLWPVLDLPEFLKKAFPTPIGGKAQLEGYITENNHKIGLNLIRELETTDLSYHLKEITIPTLIMHGAQDAIVPVEQLAIARERMRSKRIDITTFHDGDHGLTKLEHRKMMFYHISQFMQKYA